MVKEPAKDQSILELTWEEFHHEVIILSQLLPKNCCIWPVPWNGFIVAVTIKKVRPDIFISRTPLPASHDIIIDDIEDSGNTLKKYVQQGFETAVVYHRSGSLVTSKYISQILYRKDWLQFPWEIQNERQN